MGKSSMRRRMRRAGKSLLRGWRALAGIEAGMEPLEQRQLLSGVVISEIMHHPTPYNLGAEYIELHNPDPVAVDVTHWAFTSGVRFDFPAATIPAGGRLVVAADVDAFTATYGAVAANLVGGWTGQLSNSSNNIVLADAAGNTVDRVEYADSGDWAMRERGRGVQVIGGITRSGTTATATLPGHGFQSGDSIEVFGADQPSYNGVFTLSGVTTNTFNYTISGAPGPATGQMLHVRQLTDLGHAGWSWTQFADGLGASLELINPGLSNNSGQNWASSLVLGGTPGQPNSVAAADIAPMVLNVMHAPVLPTIAQGVTITAMLADELVTGLDAKLYWRRDGAATFAEVQMFDDGAHGDGAAGDGVWGGVIPAQTDRSIVEYYVWASDSGGKVRTWPAPARMAAGSLAQAANALYQVDDVAYTVSPGAPGIHRIIMTAAEREDLREIGDGGGDQESNAQMNGSFITVDGISTEVRYTVGVRNRGHGSRIGPPNNFRVNIPADRAWKGVTAVNFNVRYTHSQILGSAIYQFAGLAAADASAVELRVNGTDLADGVANMYGVHVMLENPDSDFAENHFPNDSGGNMYAAFRTDTGVYQEAELWYEGEDPNTYRDTYFKLNNTEADDWSDLIHLFDVLANTPDALFVQEVSKVINVDQWLRYIAMDSLLNNWETGINSGIGDDFYLYRGVDDPRFVLVPHDLDTILGQGNAVGPLNNPILAAGVGTTRSSTSNGLTGLGRLLTHPQITPMYYQALLGLIDTVYNPQFLNPLIDRTLGGWAAARIPAMKQYVVDRTANVLSQIPRQFTISHSLTVTGGYPTTASGSIALNGTADAALTMSILVNGRAADYDPRTGAWSVSTTTGTATRTLIPRGALWTYLDDGSDQGTAWRAADFPAAGWKSGNAELGYGEDDETTPVGYIDTDPVAADTQKNITTYFRHRFDLEAGALDAMSGLSINILRDDGAVIYVNGVEAFRTNMPSGVISHTTLAPSGSTSETTFFAYTVPVSMLHEGTNVVAVEIHQSSDTSSDISFNMDMQAVAGAATTQSLVARGAVWQYRDAGINPGVSWADVDYPETGWESGPAQLGYGDDDEGTVIDFVDTDPVASGTQYNITTWLRHTFNLAPGAALNFTGLTIDILRDDGAVVYVNGVEAFRTNMPTGTITPTTLASSNMAGAAEDTYYSYSVPVSLLRDGKNVIAVELHQVAASSADLGMDLAMTATLAGSGGGGGGGTGGVPLVPGLNRIRVEAFDGPNGTGNLVQSGYLDVNYTGSTISPDIPLPQPTAPDVEVASVSMLAPAAWKSGLPVFIQITALDASGDVQRELWDAAASLSIDRPDMLLSVSNIQLHNGLGSALVYLTGATDGAVTLTAKIGDMQISRTLASLSGAAEQLVSGTLGGSTTWSGIVHVTGDVLIPDGATLTIEPGTWVLLDGIASGTTGVDIDVQGAIRSLGTAELPVVITAYNPNLPWGELDHSSAEPSLYQYTLISRAGSSPKGGHSNSGPTVRSSGSTITFDHSAMTDNTGKIMQASSSNLSFLNTEMSRSIMGPEISGSGVLVQDSFIYEMRAADDGDGIYIWAQGAGQTVHFIGGMMGFTDDDGLDTMNSEVLVEDMIIRNTNDKGVSIYNGVTTIRRSLIIDCASSPEDGLPAAVSAKAEANRTATGVLDHVTIIAPYAAIQAKDKTNASNDTINFTVTNSILWAPDSVHIDPMYPITNVSISIQYSLLNETYAGTGNRVANPGFFDAAGYSFHLAPGSAAIDAGDPAAPADPDGSRSDMGYWSDGEGAGLPQTIAAGTLTGDFFMSAEYSPYRVTGDVVVPAGSSLRIAPGTTVFFDAGAGFTFDGGQLVAEGDTAFPIRFARTPGAVGTWDGLQFVGSMLDNRISHAILEGVTRDAGLVGLQDSSITIDHAVFDKAERRRIWTMNSSLVVRNSTFTDIFGPGVAPLTNNLSEHINGSGIPAGGQFVLENNRFGVVKGHNDAIDFDNAQLPGPIPQIIGNTFAGTGDDFLDLECDALIEGNLFMHARKDPYNLDPGNSNGISAGSGRTYHVLRNVFYDVQNGMLVKDGAFARFINNTVVNVLNFGLYFDNPGQTLSPGRGAYVDGTIFKDAPTIFGHVLPETQLAVHRSIVTAGLLALGNGNTTEDARLADPPNGDFHLRPGSPALGAGPNGVDMGAMVPGGASLLGVPPAHTARTSATLTVGGAGITHYRYRLNTGGWSDETPVATPITLAGLASGAHSVSVIGRNIAGVWQPESAAMISRTWTINPMYALRISEVMAQNTSVYELRGRYPDLIELYNDGPDNITLAGMSLSDDPTTPRKFVFPADASIAPGQHLIIYADSRSGEGEIHASFSLSAQGEGVYLYDTLAEDGALIDGVAFGPQIDNLSIGRLADGSWGLTLPTFGSANIASRTGDVRTLKINEWLTEGVAPFADDFVEFYNPDPLPVALGGLYLTDQPYIWPDKHQIAALSFIPGSGYLHFLADDNQENGPNHLNFKLSTGQEMIGLYSADLGLIDSILHGPQYTGVSQGRSPDGNFDYAFFTQPSPSLSNPGTASPDPAIRIVEINYNPPAGGSWSGSDFQFIEILNTGNNPVSLAGWKLSGGVSASLLDITLQPAQIAVIVKNAAAFTDRYGAGITIAGTFASTLSADGDLLRLLDGAGALVQDFAYSDWYASTDGPGHTLVADPSADPAAWSQPETWSPSRFILGSPGLPEPTVFVADQVIVNEVLSHSQGLEGADWIELHNPTGQDIDISHWYLSDSAGNLLKYRIPAGTVVEAGSYAVIQEAHGFGDPANPNAIIPFALSSLGDDIYLSSADVAGHLTGYRYAIVIEPAEAGVTHGFHVRSTGDSVFVPLSIPTPGEANAYPKVGPVVISEIMYSPAAGDHEFIELQNITGGPVALFDPQYPENRWKFTNGIDFTFGQALTLLPYESILIVGVEPADFLAAHSIPANIRIFGPWTGLLENNGERVALSKPGNPVFLTGEVPYYTVDSVRYGNAAPWPASPDGSGTSLMRSATAGFADDVINWAEGQLHGTPGLPENGDAFMTVTGTIGADTFFVQIVGGTLEVFASATPTGLPLVSKPVGQVLSLTFDTGDGDDTLILGTALPFMPAFIGGAGANTLAILAGGHEALADLGSNAPGLNVAIDGDAILTFKASQHLGGLTITHGGRVNLFADGSHVLRVTALGMDETATLDLADNHLVVDPGPAESASLDAITMLIRNARNGGSWNQPGIGASAGGGRMGLALMSNDDGSGNAIMTSFMGEAVDVNSILVRFTYVGDADLSGAIDGDDYFLLDRAYLQQAQPASYRTGDFDYDQDIDGSDYFQIDASFLFQSLVIGSSPAFALTVPTAPPPSASPFASATSIVREEMDELEDLY